MKLAIFLVGGPGSGKDILLKNIFEKKEFVEFNIEQIKSVNFCAENVVVVANAYDYDKVESTKRLLEDSYYKTCMVFVDVSEQVSKDRLSQRNISESIINDRVNVSKENLEKFYKIFENFYYFNNNFDKGSIQTINQITILEEKIEKVLQTPLDRFKKKLKRKDPGVNYDPLPSPKDGINQTYDTRAAGNGDLVSNYQYEALDPLPLEQGIGMGSTYGNTSKQEPFVEPRIPINTKQQKQTFVRAKKIIFRKQKTDA